jgi:ParB family chromosome partitioning protein
MTAKKKVIITPEVQPQQEEQAKDIGFKILSLDLIDDPAAPMRKQLTEPSVEDLVMSIKQVGIIEPIVVKPVNGRYEVIAGHRRTFACRLAKILEIPCYIRTANYDETEMLKIHENLYREDILPQEEARHFAYLMERQKMNPSKIAQLIGKSLSYVTDRLEILGYPDFLRESLDNKEISYSVAREFSHFGDLQQMRSAVFYAKRGGMTQEMARKWVMDWRRSKEHPRIEEVTVNNGFGEPQEIEHTATCVYCKEGLRLIEAEVVYMHSKCLRDANATAPPPPAAE